MVTKYQDGAGIASRHFVDIRAYSGYLFVLREQEPSRVSTQTPFSCVIFDVDGTLTRTNQLIFNSFNHVTKKYLQREFTPREIIGLFGPPEEGALAKILGTHLIDPAMDDLCKYYREHHSAMASLHEGMENVLSFLRSNGTKLAVFTGKGSRTVNITLEELNIARYFDLVVSGSDVGRHKPHPEGIYKIMEKLSVSPHDVLMVGDAPPDIAASRSAGVKMAAVLWDSYDKDRMLASGADFVFHRVVDLLAWFQLHTN